MSEILCRLLGKKATGCRKLITGRWKTRRNSSENKKRMPFFYVERDIFKAFTKGDDKYTTEVIDFQLKEGLMIRRATTSALAGQ
jgi:hypothetical protein